MTDLVEQSTEGFKAWTVKVVKGSAQGFLERVSQKAKASGAEVVVVKAELVFGSDHLRSALHHAKKAIAEGRNASVSISMETLLYASGERQLGSAIKKMAVDGSTELVAVACLTGEGLQPESDWVEMPRKRANVDESKLRMFGLSDQELGTVSPEKASELVLERVAAVDILKK